MMQLGFVTAILPDLDLEPIVDFAAEQDYAYIEVMCWPKGKAERRYAGVTHIDVSALSITRIQQIHRHLESRKVNISALGYYPNPMDADETKAAVYITHLKDLIKAAKRLGLERVNTFIGREQAKSVEANLEKFSQVWPPIIEFAEEHGVRIGIENCPMYFTQDEWPEGKNLAFSPAIWRQMFDIIPSKHFGLNYDPSHLLWMQMDYIKPIYEFADRLFHVHVKDAKVYPEKLNEVGILAHPLQFHSPKLPGLGDIDWGAFFSALHDIRYEGPVCVEVEDKAFEGSLEARKQSLIQCRNYLRSFI